MKPILDTSGRQIQRRAAEWLALRQARALTAAEHADFADWRDADSRHARIFAEVEAAWSALDRLSRYPHSADVAADPDLLRPPRPAARLVTFPRLAVAAAAALAVSASLIWKPWVTAERALTAEVAAAESRILQLPDGSLVELNVGARVEEAFAPAERRVRLVAGEAHFTVVKNPGRPFVVEAQGVAVRAVGTAFNVRLARTSVEVLVTEGTVQVQPATEESATLPLPPALLTEGQKTVVSTVLQAATPVVETVPVRVVDQTLAWQTSRFVFDAMPLSEVVSRFNRSGSRAVLVLDDPQLATLKFSGRVRSANVDGFVDVLDASFGIVAERHSDGRIMLRRKR